MINLVSSLYCKSSLLLLTGKKRSCINKILSELNCSTNLANNKQRSLTQFKAWLWHETTICVKTKHKSDVLCAWYYPFMTIVVPRPGWKEEIIKPATCESWQTSFLCVCSDALYLCRGDWLVFFDLSSNIEETIVL